MSAAQILRQFVADCQAAGFRVRSYAGRGYYFGFGVDANHDDGPTDMDVVRATHCDLCRDSMGLGVILYPSASLDSSEEMDALARELGLLDEEGEDEEGEDEEGGSTRCWVTLRIAIDVEHEHERPTEEEVLEALGLALSDYGVDRDHVTWGVEGIDNEED